MDWHNYLEIKQHIFKNPCFKEVTREIRKNFEMNEDDNPIYQNLWDTANVVVRGKSTGINEYIRKKKWSQISDLSFPIKNHKKNRKWNLMEDEWKTE